MSINFSDYLTYIKQKIPSNISASHQSCFMPIRTTLLYKVPLCPLSGAAVYLVQNQRIVWWLVDVCQQLQKLKKELLVCRSSISHFGRCAEFVFLLSVARRVYMHDMHAVCMSVYPQQFVQLMRN